ncbi:MAG: CTP synthase [Candidatus Berkelbacteria bacterium Licking1014_7]|uniref:CTP synthase n=1 Tax=Candidatus Berkelbacteria bacterium Licking1014_7 TaxID=2017147 RepID=A0A554LJQ8_9BACT|nr:MAG: CTP synthase [Candidatus Berkelbacteria bacterium Licking1014_7]
MNAKFIFVTGGVVSGIGKGITTGSIGALFRARGKTVSMLKIDPYLNCDAGTMNPFQHGEVFVLDDGAETDLDLGHYERLANVNLTRLSNTTTGQIYQKVLEKERQGDYLGQTIQQIPHITNEIKNHIKQVAKSSKAEIIITEIGGTVGDIEADIFLEAIRQFSQENPQNCAFVHLSKIDYIYPSEEEKTKPTQQSARALLSKGITPNILVVRCKHIFTEANREKIALFCNVSKENIIPAPNVSNLYDIPLILENQGLGKIIEKTLLIKPKKPNLKYWKKITKITSLDLPEIKIGIIGKYLNHPDAYISVIEALRHSGIKHKVRINIVPIDSENLNTKLLQRVGGILVPGGFGIRGIEGKISAIQYARENNVPFLGLCLGLQCAIIEFARNVCGLMQANSTEFSPQTPHPVIDYLPNQIKIKQKGATMRLGKYPAQIKKDSLVYSLYKTPTVWERHRHRYEVNPKYHKILQENGLIFSGLSPDKKLVEFIELKNHPFFIATQAHPEFKSRPFTPAPLFSGFIANAKILAKKTSKFQPKLNQQNLTLGLK